jgi:hypothetical protein
MSSDELSIELPLDDVLRIAGALSLGCFCPVHSCFIVLSSAALMTLETESCPVWDVCGVSVQLRRGSCAALVALSNP